jgi:uncharacterized protein (DUF433 family)
LQAIVPKGVVKYVNDQTFCGAFHPLADSPFADAQCLGDLALRPALLYEVPGMQTSNFFPVCMWAVHAWEGITKPGLVFMRGSVGVVPFTSGVAEMGRELIHSDPSIMMGKPVITGTRITVELILEKLAAGETIEQLLEAHPRLTQEAVRAALAFAAEALRADVIYPLARTNS